MLFQNTLVQRSYFIFNSKIIRSRCHIISTLRSWDYDIGILISFEKPLPKLHDEFRLEKIFLSKNRAFWVVQVDSQITDRITWKFRLDKITLKERGSILPIYSLNYEKAQLAEQYNKTF